MAINFKKINPKFLIIPLSLIIFGGINNSIQAMDNDYDQENTVDTSNNNNIINTNKLKEEIKFSDFKDFAQSLVYYDSADKNKEQEIYRKCTDFIKLLPQYIQNNASNINFEIKHCKFMYYLEDELTKLKESKDYSRDINRDVIVYRYKNIISNAGEQIGIRTYMYYWLDETNKDNVLNKIDSIINYINNSDNYFEFFSDDIEFCSNEFCLNLLLDYSYFKYLFSHFLDNVCERAYKNFLKILNDYYSKNFNKDEYKKILKVMLSNCLMCDFPVSKYENEFKNYTRHTGYPRNIIDFLIGELAKTEYNTGMRTPVQTISYKIMYDSMLPCIKKDALQFRDLMILKLKREILKHNKIILEIEKSESKEDKYKLPSLQQTIGNILSTLQYKILEIPDLINNEFNNKKGIYILSSLYNIIDIVHKATKELRKEEALNKFKVKFSIKSIYNVENINNFIGNDDTIIETMENTKPVPRKEVNINNESEKK